MWEEPGVGRYGQPIRLLRMDRPANAPPLNCDRLSDEQVSFWFKRLARRGVLYFETSILRAECERRGLSTDPAAQTGQLAIPFFEECGFNESADIAPGDDSR